MAFRTFCKSCRRPIEVCDTLADFTIEEINAFCDSLRVDDESRAGLIDIRSKIDGILVEKESNDKILSLLEADRDLDEMYLGFCREYDKILTRVYGFDHPPGGADDRQQEDSPPPDGDSQESKFDEALRDLRKQFIIELMRTFGKFTGKEFPLCPNCEEASASEINRQLKQGLTQKKKYITFNTAWSDDSEFLKGMQDIESIREEIESLQNEILEADKELKKVEILNLALSRKIQDREEVLREVSKIEAELAMEVMEREYTKMISDEKVETLKMIVDERKEKLFLLKSVSVANHVFHISHDGFFGSIGGFRLGRTESVPVPWSEINTALGMLALLFRHFEDAFSQSLTKYIIVPFGSHSRIAKMSLSNKAIRDKTLIRGYLNLYYKNEGMVKKFSKGKFNVALSHLLECLEEVYSFDRLRNLTPKYEINTKKGTVGEKSIKMSSKTYVEWSIAMKLFLIDVKQILVYLQDTL